MGTISSYFTRQIASQQIESGPSFIKVESSTPLVEEMATSKPRDGANEPWITKDEIRKHSKALADAQEFIHKSAIILERQRKIESELETCQDRLRRFTGDHARQSESNVENISSTNTPTSVELKYKQFYDHERMDAVDHIEKSRSQKERDNWKGIYDEYVACLIFEESYRQAQGLKETFLQGISLIFTSAPAIGAQYSDEKKKKVSEFQFSIKPDSRQLGYKLDQSIENSLKVIMKETAEMCDVSTMVQRTEGALKKLQDNGCFDGYKKEFFLKPEMKKYTKKCCEFVWKLTCQTTPYLVDGNFALNSRSTDVHLFNPATQQVGRDSTPSEHTSEYIDFIVWPGLFDGTSGRIIRKTEVKLRSARA